MSAPRLLVAAWLTLAWAAGAAAGPPLPEGIPPEERERVAAVAERAFVSGHAALEPYPARREVFEFLLDHPEFATHVTRALKAARYRIWRTAEGLALDDGWGTTGHFRLVHARPGLRVLHARGRYEPGLLPDIRGQAVVVLRYGFQGGSDGRPLVATEVDGFVRLESAVLNALGQIAGPLVRAKADREARQLLRVFAKVSRAIEEDPAGVCRRVARGHEVPRPDLQAFCRLLGSD